MYVSWCSTWMARSEAALWAQRGPRAKNALTAADARRVEEGFEARLASFTTAPPAEPRASRKPEPSASNGSHEGRKRARAKAIDKAALTLPEACRVRDRDHVRNVTKQRCLVCTTPLLAALVSPRRASFARAIWPPTRVVGSSSAAIG